MKKTYLNSFCARCLTLLVLALLSTNLAWGDTKTITIPIKGFKTDLGTGYQNSNVTQSYENISFVAYAFNNSTGQIRGNKTSIHNDSDNTTDGSNFHLFNTTAIPGHITKIVFKASSGTLQNKMYVAVGTTSQGSVTTTTNLTSASPSNSSFTFNFSSSDGYTFFKLCSTEKFTSGTVNAADDDAVTITYEESLTPNIEVDVEEIEFEQKELSGTVTDSKVISATGKNLTAPISADMKEGSDAIFSVVANGTPTTAAGEFTVSYSATEVGEYAGTVVLSSGETSIEIPVRASVVAHIPVLQSIAVSGTPTKTEYKVGEAFETAGLVVTGTYDVGEPQVITEGIEWVVDPEKFEAAGIVSVDVMASVGTIISEVYTVGNITVNKIPVWVKVASEPTDWSGEYLLVYEKDGTAYVWTGVDASNSYATATITNNQIAKPANATTLTIAAMEGGYSIQVNGGTNDSKYISGTKDENKINFGTTASVNTLAYDNGDVTITSNTATIMYNSTSGQDRFRYYKSGSSQKAVQLYRKSIEATMTTNGCATFSSDCALDLSNLPEGLTAYKATTAGNGKVHMVAVEEAVAASTGLFLKGTENATYTIPVAASGNALEGNLLKATTGEELAVGDYVYVIASGAFQPLGKATVVSKGKAYIPKDAITTSGKLEISFGEPTGIKSLTPALSEGKGVYNLNGMRVNGSYKGIMIMNGKKYINK